MNNLKLAVCAVFDKKAEEYQQPFVVPNKATAVRDFIRACKDEKSNLHQFASDYRLEHLADFYPHSGAFEGVPQKAVLCEAENVVVKNEQ